MYVYTHTHTHTHKQNYGFTLFLLFFSQKSALYTYTYTYTQTKFRFYAFFIDFKSNSGFIHIHIIKPPASARCGRFDYNFIALRFQSEFRSYGLRCTAAALPSGGVFHSPTASEAAAGVCSLFLLPYSPVLSVSPVCGFAALRNAAAAKSFLLLILLPLSQIHQ